MWATSHLHGQEEKLITGTFFATFDQVYQMFICVPSNLLTPNTGISQEEMCCNKTW